MIYGFPSSVTKLTYKYIYNSLINDNTVWYCLTCSKKLYPFSALNDNDFHSTIQGKTINLKPSLWKLHRKCYNRQTQ